MKTRGGNGSDTRAPRLVLEPSDFHEIQRLARDHAGLKLTPEKLSVVRYRLGLRVRELEIASFRGYLQRVRREPRELWRMIESLTNHNTSFFREAEQYPLFGAALTGALSAVPEVRVWSAGCSTGEEPYTLAMLVRQWQDQSPRRVRILGTDLSRRALASARAGRYTQEQVEPIPPALRERFLAPSSHPGSFEVAAEVRDMVRLGRLNLMDPWPMRRQLHVIFCRNVMIYFDRATQRELAQRFWNALEPGGYLFLGRAEALPAPPDPFVFVEPAVYYKPAEPA